MKISRIILTVTLGGFILLTGRVFAQDRLEMAKSDQEVFDSAKTAEHEQKLISDQKALNEDRMVDARAAEKETKAIAKETRRIDREASAAAREAKLAYRSERKAQKARKDADKQSKKAIRLKNISDKN